MDSKPLFQYIARYISLTPQEEQVIQSMIKYRRYLKRQYLVQQGDVCKYLSFVASGCLRTFHIDKEGHEHIIRFAIENWWAADLGSFSNQTPADCNVECLERTGVLQFSHESFEQLCQEVPKVERLFRMIFQNAFNASEKRVIRNFSLSAKECYLLFQEQYPQLEQRVPQYMVASYLGITKQFLSKIRNQLIHEQ